MLTPADSRKFVCWPLNIYLILYLLRCWYFAKDWHGVGLRNWCLLMPWNWEGVTDTREMKRLLKIIVKTEIFRNENLPGPTDKRFFPWTSTIHNHVTHAKIKLCYSLIDQICLQEKTNKWETTDKSVKIFFRPKSSVEQDGDEDSSDDINTDNDDDHDDIRLGKTKKTPLLFV